MSPTPAVAIQPSVHPDILPKVQSFISTARRKGIGDTQIFSYLKDKGYLTGAASTTPVSTSDNAEPDYLHTLMDTQKEGMGGVASGVEDAASILGKSNDHSLLGEVGEGAKLAGAGVDTGLAGIGLIFAPVTAAIKELATKASNVPAIQKFADSAPTSQILDAVDGGVSNLSDLAQSHPEAAKWLSRAVGLLTLEGGDAAKGPLADAAGKAVDNTADAVKNIKLPEPPGGGGGTGPLADAAGVVKQTAPSMVGDFIDSATRNVGNRISDAKHAAETRAAVKAQGPTAVRVFDESGSPEFANAIDKTKSAEDLQAKAKMLDVADQRINGTASNKLPRQVVADDYVTPRVDMLKTRLGQLGKTIGAAENDGTKVDTTGIFNHMVDQAQKMGVNVGTDEKGNLVFSKAAGVSGIDATRIASIKNMFDGFEPDENGNTSNTIKQLAMSRKNLSALTKRNDAAAEVVAPGGPIDSTRRAIAQKIGTGYHQATKDYSDIARVLGELDPDLKVRLSDASTKDIQGIKFADLARRLLSNNASKAKSVFKSLDELAQKEAARTGKALPKQNLEDLVDFAGAIEEGFGITPRNTFFGQSAGATKNALESIPTSAGDVLGHVANIISKPKADSRRALAAMKAYTQEAIAKNKGKAP